RIFLHSLGIELLHARRQTSGQGGDRCHGLAKCVHRTHLAGNANLLARYRRNRAGDGAIPGGVAEGDDRRGYGWHGNNSESAQTEFGWDRDPGLSRVPSFSTPVGSAWTGEGARPHTSPRHLSLRDNINPCRKPMLPPPGTRSLPYNSP